MNEKLKDHLKNLFVTLCVVVGMAALIVILAAIGSLWRALGEDGQGILVIVATLVVLYALVWALRHG